MPPRTVTINFTVKNGRVTTGGVDEDGNVWEADATEYFSGDRGFGGYATPGGFFISRTFDDTPPPRVAAFRVAGEQWESAPLYRKA